MKLSTKRPASERLVAFLKEDCAVFRRQINPDHFLSRIEAVGALAVIREFWQHAEAEDVHLPPGYWKHLERLKRELEQDESHT